MYHEGSLLLVQEPHSQGAELSVITAVLRKFITTNSNDDAQWLTSNASACRLAVMKSHSTEHRNIIYYICSNFGYIINED